MVRYVRWLCLLILMVSWGATSHLTEAQEEDSMDVTAESLTRFADAYMADYLPQYHIPGAVLIVVQNDEVLLSKGYGMADVATERPLTPTTPIRPASISKLATFIAILQLVDEGKISLDDDVQTLIDIPLQDTQYGTITVRHLLTHTDGFVDRVLGLAARSADEIEAIQPHFEANNPNRNIEAGQMITYGNWGSILASVIIEQVTGQSFVEYTTQQIFAPLGLADTTFEQPIPDELLARLATEYTSENGEMSPAAFVYPQIIAGGGLTSSPHDLAIITQMLMQDGEYDGVQILRPESAQAILSQQFRAHPDLPGTTFGFMEHFENDQYVLRRDGHGIESRSRLMVLPEQNMAVFLYYNVGENEMRNHFTTAFLDAFYPFEPAPAFSTISESSAKQLEGVYAAAQTDNGSYGRLQRLFISVKQFRYQEDGTFILKSINANAYSDINSKESVWRPSTTPNLYERVDGDVEDRIAIQQDDRNTYLLMGSGMLGSYRQLSWYETPLFQAVVAGFASLMFVLTLGVGTIVLRRSLKTASLRELIPMTWSVSLLFSIVAILFITIIFYAIFLHQSMMPLLPAYAFGPNWLVKLMLAFSYGVGALAAVLTITTILFLQQDASTPAKLYLTLLCSAAWAYIWLLNYWNLIGFTY